MDVIAKRLVSCFKIVFPALPESEIPNASSAFVAAWDSLAAITLLNVIEEEFGVQVNFDLLAELDSFDRLHEYLLKETEAA
jgi:acyl carrier protein